MRYVVRYMRCAVTAVTASARAVLILIFLFSGGIVGCEDEGDGSWLVPGFGGG